VASWFHGRVSGYHDNPRLAALAMTGDVRGLRAEGIPERDFAVWGGWCEALVAPSDGGWGLDYGFLIKQHPKRDPVAQGGHWPLPNLPIRSIVLTSPDQPPRLLHSLDELGGEGPVSPPAGPPKPAPAPPPAGEADPLAAERERLASEIEAGDGWGQRLRRGEISVENMLGRLNTAAAKGLK
jgi:hypothetical protein